MKITQEGANVRFQLVDTVANFKLFDFTIPKEAYDDLKAHIIKALNEFEVK